MSHFDVAVVGSGFAGAVAAARLAQAGIAVCLLERGRRYERDDFPTFPLQARGGRDSRARAEYEPPRDFSRWLWSIDQGLWDVRDLGSVMSIQAAGFGGGSLVYANVHLRAPKAVFEARDEVTRARVWPSSYSKAALEPYYDLAAFTLGVQPFPYARHPLAKTSRLLEAAQQTDGKSNWFMPPLAVAFDGARPNRWGRAQGPCDLRGYCCLGCGSGAKSTLDSNYLAIAENPRDAGRYDDATRQRLEKARPATIKTLAEVKEICRRDDGRFCVVYQDHLIQKRDSVTADNVFLCAGAVSSTALLFENRKRLFPEGRAGLDRVLGSRYHLNGGAVAVVFDCERLQQVDEGPTITSSLLYAVPPEPPEPPQPSEDPKQPERPEQREEGPSWFLVQDGGVPQELDVVLGVFRSPLWLRRNRYRETKGDQQPPEARPFDAEQRTPWGRDLPMIHLGQYHQQRAAGAREIVAMLPPHAAQRIQGAVGRASEAPEAAEDGDWWPEWLKQGALRNRTQLLDMLGIAADPLVRTTLDYLALQLENRFDDLVVDLTETVPQGRELIKSAMNLGLSRGLLRLGAQLLWGSEPDAVRHVLGVLAQPPRDLDEMTEKVVSFLRWCADYRPGDGRSAVLLTIGRDPYPGKLVFHGDGILRAHMKGARQTRLRSLQERALRAIAKEWGGELRTDPMSTFARRHVTVHSQGGCPMSESEAHGVTDENGEVYGCPGLFVMDAAAFPASVGVNPSATIAAIAERNVERFIRRRQPEWSAPRHAEFDAWLKESASFLDPLENGSTEAGTRIPCEVIGIEFKEKQVGHFASSQLIQGERPLSEIVKKKEGTRSKRSFDVETFDEVTRRVERAEREGIRAHPQGDLKPGRFLDRGEIELDLHCRIADLTKFLDAHHANKVPLIPIRGEMKVQWRQRDGSGDRFETRDGIEVSGTAQLFRPAGARHAKTVRYVLEFEFEGTPYALHGYKFIRDDARLDVWQDTATLYFGILAGESEEDLICEGVLRLPPAEFLREQVKSFKVTGTDDADRRVWALAAFATYFFGHLAESYVPELRTIPDILRNMLTRTHG